MNNSRTRAAFSALAALLLVGLIAPVSASAQESPPPGLNQTLAPDAPIARGERIISAGHVDIGPKFDNASWRLLIHDDAHRADANAQSVWRYPEETVLQVLDNAKLNVPEGQTYAFVGAAAGAPVWVVPQTQNPAVVWAGWNTQDPAVMQKMDRGAKFSVDAVQGPGILTVYLQSGDFGAPQLLWDSRKSGAQEIFVDTNTHTHANWVFTKPGVYLVRMTVKANLTDGTAASDTQLLRFAVGTETSTSDALKAQWQGSDAPSTAASAPASPSGAALAPTQSANEPDQSPLVPILIVVIVIAALLLLAGFTIAILRGNQAKRRVLAARAEAAHDPAQQNPAQHDPAPQADAGTEGTK